MPYLFLFLAFVINALASVLLKLDSSILRTPATSILGWVLSHRLLFLGLCAFAVNVIFYWLALRSLPLSVAYPLMIAGSFVLVSISAGLIFHEHIFAPQIMGYVVIFIGVLFVMLGRPA